MKKGKYKCSVDRKLLVNIDENYSYLKSAVKNARSGHVKGTLRKYQTIPRMQ